MPTIQAQGLEQLGQEIFVAVGVPREEAQIVARSLVGSNLRGHDSHGVMRLPYYVEWLQEGRLHPGVELQVRHETDVILVCDAGWGFGQVQVPRLVRRLIPKALAAGIACGTLRCAGHIGRVGEYAEIAAEAGLATIAMANLHGASQRVVPFGGKRPRLSTNPLCVGIPTDRDPIILDFATSASAEGKVRVRRIAGEPCPPGWLLDLEGNPTTDPNQLYTNPPGSLLPLGGDQGHKGYGLGLVIEMLAGGLSGGLCVRPNPEQSLGNDSVFILLDPRRFAGTEHFVGEVKATAAHVQECPTANSVEKILLPGDPERIKMKERMIQGIPLDDGNWNQLETLATRLKIPLPEVS